LREDGGDTRGRASLLLVVGLGLSLDLADDAAEVRLALIRGQVLQAGQRRQLDIEGGGKLRREDGLAVWWCQRFLGSPDGVAPARSAVPEVS
jgi:hypothetical protein